MTAGTDCVFAVLPVVVVARANMEVRMKVSVGVILMMAAL